MKMQQYSIDSQVRQLKMSRLDQLLLKNQQISLNVKEKLRKINKAHESINQNINSIRPMSYGSYGSSELNLKSNHNSSQIQTERKKQQNSKFQENKFDNQQQITFNHVQTDRRKESGNMLKNKQQSKLSQTHKLMKQNSVYLAIQSPSLQQIKKRKKQVEQIYEQLKIEQKMIQKQYQSFKKSKIFKAGQNQSKQNYLRGQKQQKNNNQKQVKRQILYEESQNQQLQQSQIKNVNQSERSFQQNYKNKKPLSISQEEISQILNQPHPYKPQPFSAHSIIFIPFNKLYRSPILQKSSNNCLMLNRMSKIRSDIKDTQIINGIKYKYSHLQTEEQSLINNTLMKNNHNSVAIVGAKDSLKKKLHMAYMAHAFNELLQIINSKIHNFLIFNITFQEIVSTANDPFQIQNSIQIQKQTTKLGLMQIESTIKQIYQAILKGSHKSKLIIQNLNKTGSMEKSKVSFHGTKQKQKILRCTKMTLFSGKDYLWSNTIISTNRFDVQFLKCLQVQNIVWSLNPLIKHYQDVSLTLNQMKNYNQMKIKKNK